MKNVLLVGSGSLLEMMAVALQNSEEQISLSIFTDEENENLQKKVAYFKIGSILNNTAVASYAISRNVDLVIITGENILWAGLADVLRQMNLPVFGPDKVFARSVANPEIIASLFVDYKIKGVIQSQTFSEEKPLFAFMDSLQKDFVIQTDKSASNTDSPRLRSVAAGPLFWGKDFSTLEKAKEIAVHFLQLGIKVTIKKVPAGKRFSLVSVIAGDDFVSGKPITKDKTEIEPDDLAEAVRISKSLVIALKKKYPGVYQGLLCCYFYLTAEGAQLFFCSSLPDEDIAQEFFARFEARTFPLKPDRLDFYRLASISASK